MVIKAHKCSTCKQAGHNSRTCHKTEHLKRIPNVPHNTPFPRKQNRSTQKIHIKTTPTTLAGQSVNNIVPTRLLYKQQSKEIYTTGDLETLWALMEHEHRHGADADQGVHEEAEKLTSLVSHLKKSDHVTFPTAAVWKGFFKTLPTALKIELVKLYQPAEFNNKAHTGTRWERLLKSLRTHNESVEREVLPPELFEALSSEKSTPLLTLLTTRSHIPDEVAVKLANVKNVELAETLTANKETQGHVLEIIENNLNSHETRGVFTYRETTQPSDIKRVRLNLTTHPNLTKKLATHYLNNTKTGHPHPQNDLYLKLLAHPVVDESTLKNHLKHLGNLEQITKQSPAQHTRKTWASAGLSRTPQEYNKEMKKQRTLLNHIALARVQIFTNPNAPKEELLHHVEMEKTEMLKPHHAINRSGLCGPLANPKIPSPIVKELYSIAKQKNLQHVIQVLVRNPNIGKDVLEDVVNTYKTTQPTPINPPSPAAKIYEPLLSVEEKRAIESYNTAREKLKNLDTHTDKK